ALVGRLYNGLFSGSYRTFGKLKMKDFLSESNLVEEAVGHNPAGGFSIKEENIGKLKEYIEENISEFEVGDETTLYDIELDISDVNFDVVRDIERFNYITGTGFPKIIVKVSDITIDEVNTIGKTQETRKFSTM